MSEYKYSKDDSDAEKTSQKRSTNFKTNEIEFLLKMVENRKDIIECKKTDRTSSEDKIRCWKEIEEQFNCAFDIFRPYKTLKTKYENIKKEAKKNFALDRIELYKTGGGRKPPSNITTLDENVLNIVQEEQLIGHESIYDDDKIQINMLENMPIEVAENSCEEINACSQDFDKWKHYSPKMLKTKKHKALETKEKQTTKDVWADVAKKKIEKINLEMEIMQEEWRLKKKKIEMEIDELQRRVELNSLEIKDKFNNQKKTYPKEF